MLRHLIRIRSEAEYKNLLTQCAAPIGVIPRQADIPILYTSEDTWDVYTHNNTAITIVETASQRFDVFEVPSTMIRSAIP